MNAKILSLLPGGDCFGRGGCGKATCAECAEAIAAGGACVAAGACVQGIIRMVPRDATNFIPCSNTMEDDEEVRKTCGFGCIACSDCVRACPEGAVEIINNHAVIDYDKCVGCVACTVKCKKKIIVDTMHDLTKLKEKVAFVKCSGFNEHAYKEAGFTSCAEAAAKADPKAMGICTTGCTGQGDCVKVCRYGAIEVVNGSAQVNPDKCVGCKDCYYACPKNLIEMVPYKGAKMVPCSSTADYEDKAAVCGSACIACEDCVSNCPNGGAIEVVNGSAQVNPDKCVGCKDCYYACPKNLIEMVPYKGAKMVPCSSTADYEDKAAVCGSACIACEDCVSNCPNGAIHMEEAALLQRIMKIRLQYAEAHVSLVKTAYPTVRTEQYIWKKPTQ